MKRVIKPELVQQGLRNLEDAYTDANRRAGIHATDLIYCLTKTWFDKNQPLPPTPQEVLLFSVGWGLQMVLFPPAQLAKPIELEGIICSPDYKSRSGNAELKTTRMSTHQKNKETGEAEDRDIPDTWNEQIMAYCYVSGQTKYDLLILHLMGNYKPPFPVLVGWEISFERQELRDYWEYLKARRDILMHYQFIPPEPYEYCKEWECKNCRYMLRCNMVSKVYSKQEE